MITGEAQSTEATGAMTRRQRLDQLKGRRYEDFSKNISGKDEMGLGHYEPIDSHRDSDRWTSRIRTRFLHDESNLAQTERRISGEVPEFGGR